MKWEKKKREKSMAEYEVTCRGWLLCAILGLVLELFVAVLGQLEFIWELCGVYVFLWFLFTVLIASGLLTFVELLDRVRVRKIRIMRMMRIGRGSVFAAL